MDQPRPESNPRGAPGDEAPSDHRNQALQPNRESLDPNPRFPASKKARSMQDSDARPPRTILIIDDHVMYRLGLARLLGKQAGLTVLGTCESGVTALSFLREHRCDLVIL